MLAEHVVAFAPFIWNDFVFMHDNVHIKLTEHLWGEIGRNQRQRPCIPANQRELGEAPIEEWSNIDQEIVVLQPEERTPDDEKYLILFFLIYSGC